MLKGRFFLIFSALLLCSLPVRAKDIWTQMSQTQTTLNSYNLFSPSVGKIFYEMAYEMVQSEDITKRQAKQAIMFLTATIELDRTASYALPEIIKLLSRHHDKNNVELLTRLLISYSTGSVDLEVVNVAIRYLLDQLNSREEREKLLEEVSAYLGDKNKTLNSELNTLLGLLTAEKTDFETASSYFMQAFNSNKYNRLAFAKLSELTPEQIRPEMRLEHLILALGINPLDIETAFNFAQYAEQLQLYDTAASAYEYCADLFSYLHPSKTLPAYIYLPWTISCYNTQRNQHKCLQIADGLRKSGRFDLLAEAIAGRAAAKIGNIEQAKLIFQATEEKAQKIYSTSHQPRPNQLTKYEIAEQLAWFYCFASPEANKAIDWANKAYSIEPNSVTSASILAYALLMNGQTDWAKQIINNYPTNNIASLAMAQIQLQQGQQSSAFEILKSVIAKDPGSLEAEQAKRLLTQHGGEYIAAIDSELISVLLRNSVGPVIVPSFTTPDKIISVQLNLPGSKFSYGSELNGIVTITNNSLRPFVISDTGLFRGNIRIDANISGDLDKKIPNLISIKTRPSLPTKPGQNIIVPVRLNTAELRQILASHPQASLKIEFTVYLDPVTTENGKVTNRLSDIEPAKIAVKRPGINLTGKFLNNRFNSLTKGPQGPRIKTAQLFIGLLMEQHSMANREPFYKFMYADWMPTLLKSGLVHNLTEDDWVAKVHIMAAMLHLPLDYELINVISKNLSDTHWPVRMMAISLLAKSQGSSFNHVLDWTAKYDSNELVRNMAIALGAAMPKSRETTNQITLNGSEEQPSKIGG